MTQAQVIDLIRPISFSKLEAGLNGIDDSKSPRLDCNTPLIYHLNK